MAVGVAGLTGMQVDFINVHLGLGFPIPLVMLNEGDILGGRDIACIIGNFGAYSPRRARSMC